MGLSKVAELMCSGEERAQPKSHSTAWQRMSTKILEGLTSLCMMLAEWMYLSARNTW
eukprot:CAMPEP_0115747652 /NCGR_PEP_ID=MMETSP0272-20121206/93272_1 /TAXON_ID=71861 /ORGANISM="Scrippsiella trochoidea, Strain CCMP3099" /LENGTH=56 /DNA_ID=CAMNT_0003192649 /DNA_START=420 /DNA_END=590 /DNA_ORIENTATION=-